MDYEQPKPRTPMVPGPSAKQVGVYAPATSIEHTLKEIERAHAATALHATAAPRPSPIAVGNLAGAIASVMSQCGTIKKGGFNKFYQYNYVRMEDLLEAVTPLMGAAGIAIFQNQMAIRDVGNRLVVDYDFTVTHKSNEIMGPLRQSGMCIAKTSKGDYDDKAINKCHTQARKYFLLSLFQVPAGDFPDSDEDGDANQQQQRVVPGPKPKLSAKEEAAAKVLDQEGIPHKIVLSEGTTADQWANAYIRNIGKAKTQEELQQFDALNDAYLQRISDGYNKIYEMIKVAFERRMADLTRSPTGMPNPKENAQEAMNWIASQLQTMMTYEAAEAFWNTVVGPCEKDFDQMDWEMLMQEWERTEQRLSPSEGASQ